VKVYLEAGEKKVFVTAIDWLGLARSGKTEDAALEALINYVPRYLRSRGAAAQGLSVPVDVNDLQIVARLPGNKTTDFGAPDAILPADREHVAERELGAAIKHLQAAWDAFEAAAKGANGKTLAPSGPRGGGRSVEKMVAHVREADEGYVSAIGGKARPVGAPWQVVQDNFIAALKARNAGELPDVGPRGGERWTAMFAMRRSAWHSLDHAWELEDRTA
jgi:hypothetical protein